MSGEDIPTISESQWDSLQGGQAPGVAAAPSVGVHSAVPQDLPIVSESQWESKFGKSDPLSAPRPAPPLSLGQSARFVGKSALEGLVNAAGAVADYNPLNPDFWRRQSMTDADAQKAKVGPLLHQAFIDSPGLSPDTEGVGGAPADVIRAGSGAMGLPGNPVMNFISGITAELAHKAFPESKVAPFLGALTPAGAEAGLMGAFKGAKSALAPITKEGMQVEAGKMLTKTLGATGSNELQGAVLDELAPDTLTAEIAPSSNKIAGITKEIEKDPGLGQDITDVSTGRKNALMQLAQGLGGDSTNTLEARGSNIRDAWQTAADKAKGKTGKIWDYVHTAAADLPIDRDAINNLRDVTDQQIAKYSGPKSAPLDSKLGSALSEVQDAENWRFKDVQDLRSRVENIKREGTLTPQEMAIANHFSGALEAVGDQSLSGVDPELAQIWKQARGFTKEDKTNFASGFAKKVFSQKAPTPDSSVGMQLISSPEAAKQFMTGANEEGITQARGFIGDHLLRQDPDRWAGVFKNPKQASAIKTILGDEHFNNLQTAIDDLQSYKDIGNRAAAASKGQSATAEFSTVAKWLADNSATKRAALIEKGARAAGAGIGAMGGSLGAVVGEEIAGKLTNGLALKTAGQMKEIIAQAVKDPEYAKLLVSKATDANKSKFAVQFAKTLLPDFMGSSLVGAQASEADQNSTQNKKANSSDKQPEGSGGSAQKSTETKSIDDAVHNVNFEPEKTVMQDNSTVPAKLVDTMIKWESQGKPNAVSPKGAQGLMQIEPDTFAEEAGKLGLPKDADPFDPDINKQVGTAYIGGLLKKYKGDVPTALAAYNWGLGHVDKAHTALDSTDFKDLSSVLPDETQNYVKNIMADYEA